MAWSGVVVGGFQRCIGSGSMRVLRAWVGLRGWSCEF